MAAQARTMATLVVLATPALVGSSCSSSGGSTDLPADGGGQIDGSDGNEVSAGPDAGPDDLPPQDRQDDAQDDLGEGQDAAAGDLPDGLDALDAPPVTESPGTFVAVGYGGRRTRSLDDGLTWIDDVALAANGADDQTLLRAVGWGDQGFLAVGYRVMASADGKTWEDRGATLNQGLGSVVRARGLFVAVGGFGLRVSSADGVTWQRNGIDNIASHSGSGLVFTEQAGGRFVSANDNGARSSSPDGVRWTYSPGAEASKSTLLAFGNGVGVGVGGTDVVISTDGGSTWTAAPALPVPAQSLVFARGHFTAVAAGHVLTSTDARTWTDQAVAGIGGNSLAYGHGAYVLVDNTGGLKRSTDGMAWTPVLARGNNGLGWVAFGAVGATASANQISTNPKTE
jgi:hypothetical protein